MTTTSHDSGQPTAAIGAPVFRAAGTGPATWAMGSLFERLVSGPETADQLGAALVTQPPGIATPLHVHSHEAEAFYLLEGSMTYRAGEEMFHLVDGDFLYLPRGVPHAFRVTGTTPVRYLALTVPGRLLGLYDEVGMPASERRLPGDDGPPMAEEIARWNSVGPAYGLTVVGPPLREGN
jgi:quercetin dioxygenase-like cupin family protein